MSSKYLQPDGMSWTPHPHTHQLLLLEGEVFAKYPFAEIAFEPAKCNYSWRLDVIHAGRHAVVQWNEVVYGISDVSGMSGTEGYGDRPDVSTPNFEDAKRRLFVVLHIEVPQRILDTLAFYAKGQSNVVWAHDKNTGKLEASYPLPVLESWRARDTLKEAIAISAQYSPYISPKEMSATEREIWRGKIMKSREKIKEFEAKRAVK